MHTYPAGEDDAAWPNFGKSGEKYERRSVHKSDSRGEEIGGMGHLVHWLRHSFIISREGLILTLSILPCPQGGISQSTPCRKIDE